MVNVDLKGQLKILYRVWDNDRAIRRRPEQNHKAEPLYIFQEADKSDFAKRNGDYGKTWAEKVKGKWNAMPSLREVFVGMKLWFVALTEANLVGRTVNQKRRIIKRAKEDIDQLLSTVKITPEQWDQPLHSGPSDLDLHNPYGAAACWILSVYSMEFGTPPFYSALNKAAREMDTTQLDHLGPFANALYLVCRGAENYKEKEDKIPTGSSFSDVDDNLSGSFLLWRGAQMQQQWLDPFL